MMLVAVDFQLQLKVVWNVLAVQVWNKEQNKHVQCWYPGYTKSCGMSWLCKYGIKNKTSMSSVGIQVIQSIVSLPILSLCFCFVLNSPYQ